MAAPRLEVIIVGAGIAGLTCAVTLAQCSGIYVTVLDKVTRAQLLRKRGIQLPPNATRALRGLGVLNELIDKGIKAEGTYYIDYKSDEELMHRELDECEEVYGSSWLFIDRAEVIKVLMKRAENLGVRIKTGIEVQQVNFQVPFVKFTTGGELDADIIIAADGTNSRIRKLMFPSHPPPLVRATRYHAVLKVDDIFNEIFDTELALIPRCQTYLGPRAHANTYPTRQCESYSFELIIADGKKYGEFWDEDGPNERGMMEGWSEVIEDLAAMATFNIEREVLKDMVPLAEWHKGNVALIGNAAYPMLPYLHQDVAMGIEDAVVLGTLLSRLVESVPDLYSPLRLTPFLPTMINVYETLQRPRKNQVAAKTRKTGRLNHSGRKVLKLMRNWEFERYDCECEPIESSVPWIDGAFNRKLLGRNVVKKVRTALLKLGTIELYMTVDGEFRLPVHLSADPS